MSEVFSDNYNQGKRIYIGFEPLSYHSYVVFQEIRKGGTFSKYFPLISKKNIYTTSSVFEQGLIVEIKLNDNEYQRLFEEFKKPKITKAKSCGDATCAILRNSIDNETMNYLDPAKVMDELIDRTQEEPNKYRLFNYGHMELNNVISTFKKQKNSLYYMYGGSLTTAGFSGAYLYILGYGFGLW
jgi:hypothetical protein